MNSLKAATPDQRRLWRWIVAILLGLGILFRVAHLHYPVYWVDEVATSMRVSGYTQAEVTQQVATGQPLTPSDLLEFQKIRRDRPLLDLGRVLTQSPEHAPLYFILARFWAEVFGSSIVAMRSLSVVFSLLALPAMYGLGQALFTAQSQPSTQATLVGQIAMGLLAISPFFIAYAQEARPYSLWILLLLLINQLLWRSLQSNQRSLWIGYAVSLTLGLYTSLLTILVVLGQGLVVMVFHSKRRLPYLITTGAALILLLPWCWVIATHWQILSRNTVWMQQPIGLLTILGTWGYSLAVLFFDVPVATAPLLFAVQVAIAATIIALIGYAAYVFVRQAPFAVVRFTAAGALSIPAILLLIDLLREGQAAATPRYLMPVHLAVLITLAYLLSTLLGSHAGHNTASFTKNRMGLRASRWRVTIALLISVSLLSCLIGLSQDPPYLKSRNLSNKSIAAELNEAKFSTTEALRSPQLITTAHYIQDMISLSYQLDPAISLYILPDQASPEKWLVTLVSPDRPTFLFTPSKTMIQAVQTHQLGTLRSVFQPDPLISGEYGLTLWQIQPSRFSQTDLTEQIRPSRFSQTDSTEQI